MRTQSLSGDETSGDAEYQSAEGAEGPAKRRRQKTSLLRSCLRSRYQIGLLGVSLSVCWVSPSSFHFAELNRSVGGFLKSRKSRQRTRFLDDISQKRSERTELGRSTPRELVNQGVRASQVEVVSPLEHRMMIALQLATDSGSGVALSDTENGKQALASPRVNRHRDELAKQRKRK